MVIPFPRRPARTGAAEPENADSPGAGSGRDAEARSVGAAPAVVVGMCAVRGCRRPARVTVAVVSGDSGHARPHSGALAGGMVCAHHQRWTNLGAALYGATAVER